MNSASCLSPDYPCVCFNTCSYLENQVCHDTPYSLVRVWVSLIQTGLCCVWMKVPGYNMLLQKLMATAASRNTFTYALLVKAKLILTPIV